MNSSDLTKLGISFAMLYGIYKLVPNSEAKAGAIAVASVIVAKQLPYIKDVI